MKLTRSAAEDFGAVFFFATDDRFADALRLVFLAGMRGSLLGMIHADALGATNDNNHVERRVWGTLSRGRSGHARGAARRAKARGSGRGGESPSDRDSRLAGTQPRPHRNQSSDDATRADADGLAAELLHDGYSHDC